MTITFNPQVKYAQTASFGTQEAQIETNPASALSLPDTDSANQLSETTKTSHGFLANVAYAWVNFAEGTKGILKGLFYGLLAGGIVATVNSFSSGLEKFRKNQIKLQEILNPRKAMSKTGAVLTTITAAAVFVGNLILARLRTNSRTANVDHMLYEGHRDK